MAAVMEEPSKPQNAYWIWLSENREKITKEAGSGRGSVVGKLAGEKWKALGDAQKAPFEAKAKAAKAAYEKAMEEFKAQGGEPGKRRREKADAKKEKAGKKAKTKDPNRPKKPATGYWLWLGENRAALTKEVGPGKVTEVSKLGGQRWKALPEAQKAPFEKKAKELKAAYDKALAEYKKNNGGADDDDDEDDEEQA